MSNESLIPTRLAAVDSKTETPTTTAIQRAPPPHLPSCDVQQIRTKRIQKNLLKNKKTKSAWNSDNTKHHPWNNQKKKSMNPTRKRDGGLMKKLAEELYTTEQECFDMGELV